VFFARGHGVWVLLPVLLAPPAWAHVRRLRRQQSPGELIALLGDSGKLLAAYAILFAIGLLV
jgi:1,4-dihydroxy-2-naphthoate polyprenyltransferase